MAEGPTTGRSSFSDSVVLLFAAQFVTTAISVFNSFFFARLLGPAGKGEYYILTLTPATIMVLIQFGLPPALGFYTARDQTRGIVRRAILVSLTISFGAFACAVAALPLIESTIMRGIPRLEIVFGLSAIPILLTATFVTAICNGRRVFGWYAASGVAQVVATTALLGTFVGVLGLGVPGGVAAFLIASTIGCVVLLTGAIRVTSTVHDPARVPIRALLRYGIPLYPGSITTFFSYRIDVFLLAAMLTDPAAPLGYYSVAVSMAELLFMLPNSVSTVFFPLVAGATREEADRQVTLVSRVTLLLTAGVALLLAPAATIGILVLLPAFAPSLPALYILLPGIVALSVANVVTGYLTGLEKTGRTSLVNVGGFVLNVAINFVAIPMFGIVGAAGASLISYSATALAATLIAARLAHAPLGRFWLPGRADAALALTAAHALTRRVTLRTAGA